METKPKNIVICLDGTGDEYNLENQTNVVRTSELAIRSDEQLLYYDPGVGTGGFAYSSNLKRYKHIAFGDGVQKNVEDAYRFLMKNYTPGDKIFLFGFSRGAFTARSLAGMIYHCGLLHPYMDNLVEYVSKIYNQKKLDLCRSVKVEFGVKCPIHFLGVWDTVASLGVITGQRFHDHHVSPEVANAYHAVALDEKRKKFQPCLFDTENTVSRTNLSEVWFAGVHCDVGGWYKDAGRAKISLLWILKKAANCGLLLDPSWKFIKSDYRGKTHNSLVSYWRLLGTKKRELPNNARIHISVKEAMENTDYTPEVPIPGNVEWDSSNC